MIISSPYLIILSAEEHAELTVRANGARAAHRDVVRAHIILAAADGRSNAAIAAHLRLHVDTVRKWRRRFHRQRLAGLTDRPRTGRPRRFSAVQVAEVKALACELPADADIPLARWSCPELAAEASRRGVVASISASTVRRWLAADAIRPWQHRSWIFPRDPDFAFKAGRVLDLYARIHDGVELGEDEYVLSADEKPGVQARERIHPSRPARPGRRPMLVESEYRRHGTLAYLAAYDVHHAHVIGHCAPTTGIQPFTALAEKVMTTRALRRRPTGVLDRRQRRLPPRLDRRRPTQRGVPEHDHDPHPSARVLAEPDRDLLLRRPTKATHPRPPPQPRGPSRATDRVRGPLQPRRTPLRLAIQP
jgi:transposase